MGEIVINTYRSSFVKCSKSNSHRVQSLLSAFSLSLSQSQCKHAGTTRLLSLTTYPFLKSIHATFNCIILCFLFLFFSLLLRYTNAVSGSHDDRVTHYFEITSWKRHVLAQASARKSLPKIRFRDTETQTNLNTVARKALRCFEMRESDLDL